MTFVHIQLMVFHSHSIIFYHNTLSECVSVSSLHPLTVHPLDLRCIPGNMEISGCNVLALVSLQSSTMEKYRLCPLGTTERQRGVVLNTRHQLLCLFLVSSLAGTEHSIQAYDFASYPRFLYLENGIVQ